MSNGQYYIKKNGRYVKANDTMAWEGLSEGSWLVTISPGSKSAKNFIKPKFAELDAALYFLHEGLTKAMIKASEMRPRSTKMSVKEQRAWKAYKKIMGEDIPAYFEYASLSEIADKGCEYLKKVIYENKYDVKKIKEKYEVKPINVSNSIMDLEV